MSQIMGILNITPDSYVSTSRYLEEEKAYHRALEIEQEGAHILDIGGESTRPFSEPVALEEELKRVIPVIEKLKGVIKIPISIDTMKVAVAKAAIEAGASLINDITGFIQDDMRNLARDYQVDVCVMHMQGIPKSMQENPRYPRGVIIEILNWFEKQVNLLEKAGIKKEKIILDPGIGFGKTVEHNLQILAHLHEFKKMGFRILIGASRKSFLQKLYHKRAEQLLFETLGVSGWCAAQGIDILRVHDILPHKMLLSSISAVRNYHNPLFVQ